MKVGDLVKPIIRCSGTPGDQRCEFALVVTNYGWHALPRYETVEILCKHGVGMQYADDLESINESR